jgi:hypothetical protein
VRQGLRYRRRIAIALLAAALLGAAVLLTRDQFAADAEALVVGEKLDLPAAALPGYGEAVFNNGQVAQAVADELGVDPDSVVPGRVSLTAAPDTVVLRVTGHAEDEATAQLIANTAAAAYVAGLNAPGVGVGQFALLGPASPTDRPALAAVPNSVLADLPVAITVVLALGVLLLFTRLNRTRAPA